MVRGKTADRRQLAARPQVPIVDLPLHARDDLLDERLVAVLTEGQREQFGSCCTWHWPGRGTSTVTPVDVETVYYCPPKCLAGWSGCQAGDRQNQLSARRSHDNPMATAGGMQCRLFRFA